MSHSLSLDLQQKQTPSLKQMQRLMMSQHMQQALHYLQLPIMELGAALEYELEQNPLLELSQESEIQDPETTPLEIEDQEAAVEEESEFELEKALSFDEHDLKILQQLDEDFRDHFNGSEPYRIRNSDEEKWQTYQESLLQTPTSLFEHLMKQALEIFSDPDQRAMAELIIGNFDERGFLDTPLSELALLSPYKEEELEAVVTTIQTFDPAGVGAKNLRESLLLQLKRQNKEQGIAFSIVENYYECLLHNQILKIKKGLKCSEKALSLSLDEIAKLDLHPASSYTKALVQVIRPDLILKLEGELIVVEVEKDFIPPFRFSRRYLRLLEDEQLPIETRNFINQKMVAAKWLLHTVHQRNSTLERIGHLLAQRQREFFMQNDGKLVPLTMKMVAEELEVHESTIARTVANKYIDTPRGIWPLRSFFTTALATAHGEEVSSQSVRELLVKLIKEEDKRHPLSDNALAAKVQGVGIQCARRTVAKYRLLLKIGNAQQRKQF